MSDIQEQIKLAHKRAEENDIKLLKEELEEILDRLERIDHKEYIAFEFADSATFDEIARCFNERKKMANYITNLQEELEYQKQAEIEYNEKHLKLMNMYSDLKSRNEKAIEIIEKYGKEKQLEEDYLMNRVNLANYNCLLLNILQGEE